MRFCLECRRLTGEGPICNSCGRSFGGRLCGGKKHHLNPPNARVCGHCGSTTLRESARSIPLGCLSHLLLWVSLLALGIVFIPVFLGKAGGLFTASTGYRDPLVWLIDQSARFLIPLGVIYYGLGLLPGDLGKSLQNLLKKSLLKTLNTGFGLLQRSFLGLIRTFYQGIEGKKEK